MRENRLRTMWKAGEAAINGWLAIPNSFSAETMAHQGWDTLTIDLQHGVVDYQAMVTMLQAISTTNTVPVVRVPWLEPGILMKTLDAGAYGVICPMVSTREDAQKLVAYTSYAPKGTRSFGPVRALLYGGADYPQYANDTIVRFAMIETAQALDNLDAILSVEGLDAIYIGPSRSHSAANPPSTTWTRRRHRPSTTSSSAPRRMAWWPASTTAGPRRR
jgi:4-hydroxy-2-oxoheptanedioate aldolase